MTRDEFYEKYGDVVVTFSSYYKFTFNYRADLPDGSVLTVGYGGSSDDIYRYEVSNNESITVKQVRPYTGSVYKDGIEVEHFYDY